MKIEERARAMHASLSRTRDYGNKSTVSFKNMKATVKSPLRLQPSKIIIAT